MDVEGVSDEVKKGGGGEKKWDHLFQLQTIYYILIWNPILQMFNV